MSGYRRFKSYLIDNGIKYKEIAELLGNSISTVTRKINRYKNSDFTILDIKVICIKYGISADKYFFV